MIVSADLAGLLLITSGPSLWNWSPRWIYWQWWMTEVGGRGAHRQGGTLVGGPIWYEGRRADSPPSMVDNGSSWFYLCVLVGGPPPQFCVFSVVFILSLWLQSCDPKGNCLSAYNKGQRWDWELHSSELIVRDNARHWRMKLADVYISLSL